MDKRMKEMMETAIKLHSSHTKDEIIKILYGLYPKAPATTKSAMAGLEMYESLNHSVDQAGGTKFQLERLNEMTVMDLISALATNGIRFVYQKIQPR